MPYIDRDTRMELLPIINELAESLPFEDPGTLNYTITELLLAYLGGAQSYKLYNEIVGVLESVKLEFYRRAVAPYEDVKVRDNGDLYD